MGMYINILRGSNSKAVDAKSRTSKFFGKGKHKSIKWWKELSDNLVKKGLHASTIIKSIASDIDGSGGGQPFYATAGGKRASGIDTAVKKIIESITA